MTRPGGYEGRKATTMKINITDEIRQEILDTLNRDTAKEYFEKLRDTEKNPRACIPS